MDAYTKIKPPGDEEFTQEKRSSDLPNRCLISCESPVSVAGIDFYHLTCVHTQDQDKDSFKWCHSDDTSQRTACCPPISHDSSVPSNGIWATNLLRNFDKEHQVQGQRSEGRSLNSCDSAFSHTLEQIDNKTISIDLFGECNYAQRRVVISVSCNALSTDNKDDVYRQTRCKAQNFKPYSDVTESLSSSSKNSSSEFYPFLFSSGSDSDRKFSSSAEICSDVQNLSRGFLRRTLNIPRHVRKRLYLTYPTGLIHFYRNNPKSVLVEDNQRTLLKPKKWQSHSHLPEGSFTSGRNTSNKYLCKQTTKYFVPSSIHHSLEKKTTKMYKSTDLLCDNASAHPSCSVPKASVSENSPLKAQRRGEQLQANIIYDSCNNNHNAKIETKGEFDKFSTKFFETSNVRDISFHEDLIKEDCKSSPFASWRLLDFALAYLWVGPLVTVYWCNSWHIPENYLFPVDPKISGWISGAVGYTLYFLASFFQENITSFTIKQTNIAQLVIVQTFSYVMCWACVSQWRCVWVLLDEYTGVSTMNAAVTYAAASAFLMILRSHKTTASAPTTVRMDLPVKKHFTIGKYFDAQLGTWAKVGDSLFSVFVIDSLGISVWRGLWEVLDLELSPDVKSMSGVWSLVISYGLASMLFLTQVPIRRMSIYLENVHWLVHLAFEDVITILYTVVAITHWRGYWTLMDVYLPYKPVSHWVCHGASFLLLAIGLAATSVPVLGCIKDGKLSNGKGVVFDNFYFSHLRSAWRSRNSKSRERSTHNYSNACDELSNDGTKDFIMTIDVSSHEVRLK